jgi:hypothetical protein
MSVSGHILPKVDTSVGFITIPASASVEIAYLYKLIVISSLQRGRSRRTQLIFEYGSWPGAGDASSIASIVLTRDISQIGFGFVAPSYNLSDMQR